LDQNFPITLGKILIIFYNDTIIISNLFHGYQKTKKREGLELDLQTWRNL